VLHTTASTTIDGYTTIVKLMMRLSSSFLSSVPSSATTRATYHTIFRNYRTPDNSPDLWWKCNFIQFFFGVTRSAFWNRFPHFTCAPCYDKTTDTNTPSNGWWKQSRFWCSSIRWCLISSTFGVRRICPNILDGILSL